MQAYEGSIVFNRVSLASKSLIYLNHTLYGCKIKATLQLVMYTVLLPLRPGILEAGRIKCQAVKRR
jgi:hypothetical protein